MNAAEAASTRRVRTRGDWRVQTGAILSTADGPSNPAPLSTPSSSTAGGERVLVFMSDNRDLDAELESASYVSLVAAINLAYCRRHGYAFRYFRPHLRGCTDLHNCIDPHSRGEVRHASWSKILSALRAIDIAQTSAEYDYICYLDSDCIVKDHARSMRFLLDQADERPVLFFENLPWNPGRPCFGVFVCKVGMLARDVLETCFDAQIAEFNLEFAWEQNALWGLMDGGLRTGFETHIGLVHEMMFEEQEGQFLRHIGSKEDLESATDPNCSSRDGYFRRVLAEQGLDFSGLMRSIVADGLYERFDSFPQLDFRAIPWYVVADGVEDAGRASRMLSALGVHDSSVHLRDPTKCYVDLAGAQWDQHERILTHGAHLRTQLRIMEEAAAAGHAYFFIIEGGMGLVPGASADTLNKVLSEASTFFDGLTLEYFPGNDQPRMMISHTISRLHALPIGTGCVLWSRRGAAKARCMWSPVPSKDGHAVLTPYSKLNILSALIFQSRAEPSLPAAPPPYAPSEFALADWSSSHLTDR